MTEILGRLPLFIPKDFAKQTRRYVILMKHGMVSLSL